jgi:Pellino
MVQVNPADVIYSLNSLRPQCPVLFNSITFSYINSEERVRRAYRRLESSGESYSSVGPMHIPTSNYDHVEEEQRSYVFPSCGHVHGYHKSLQDRCYPAVSSSSLFPLHLLLLPYFLLSFLPLLSSSLLSPFSSSSPFNLSSPLPVFNPSLHNSRPCPLCRKTGAFVPIAFAFEPAICHSSRPTHVFNPCGHVASRHVCEKWSKILMHGSSAVTQVLKPFCPFCAT